MFQAWYRGWSVVNTLSRRNHVASANVKIRHAFGDTFLPENIIVMQCDSFHFRSRYNIATLIRTSFSFFPASY